ncbi:uncharacterized protein LOC111410206 [Olea europaea var. sylvestris]|uniref:uncharacterized protein LOC111410206 n=1 Tax=Olea europaea var. sylvestris TaxID=158386 RepID=UPI000C1D377F|nr:uncharacterized protein LOC111410206 [Olea europaea var. sylvestris]
MDAEYGGWGAGSVATMLCIILCLIFLPLAMGPGSLQPPPSYAFLIFPVLMAAILIFLTQASKNR